MALWFPLVLICPVSHHRHHPRQHLDPGPDVPGQVTSYQINPFHLVLHCIYRFLAVVFPIKSITLRLIEETQPSLRGSNNFPFPGRSPRQC